ncbi:MAG TPA: SHOCT domain-containing protein [Solirubrobacteraceae bacterium]
MRRRPLLRAAAVGGGAYMMGKRHAAGQQDEADQDQRIADLESQQQAPAPAPAAAAAPSGGISSDAMAKLQELGKLRDQGILTDDEFATQKERLLAV